jgi:hypothetical protein
LVVEAYTAEFAALMGVPIHQLRSAADDAGPVQRTTRGHHPRAAQNLDEREPRRGTNQRN